MSSLSGTFTAAGNVTGFLLLKPGQAATYTLTESAPGVWNIKLEESENPAAQWNILSSYIDDISATVINDGDKPKHYRLRCDSIAVVTVDWTLADVTGEIQGEIKNPQTGVTEITFTDQGVTVNRNLSVTGTTTYTGGETHSGTQTFSGQVNVTDSLFSILDNATPTKIAKFECSGISSATTRTLTIPNSSGTIAYLAGSTFTTATLTAPTITTPTINGALVGTGTVSKSRYFAGVGQVGAGAGFVLSTGTNVGRLATCPASQTAATLVVKFNGLAVNDIITGFYLLGQVESGGGTVTVDVALRKLTAAAADLTDAAVESMTQVSVTADTVLNSSTCTKTLVAPLTIASDVTHYLLITVTTGASCDIDLMAAGLVITHTVFNSGE